MIRWLLVAGTLLAVLFALLGVRSYRPSETVFDEVSVYEITPQRPIRVRIPGGVEELIVTSWAIVAPGTRWSQVDTYRYGLEIELEAERDQRTRRHAFPLTSRISYDPRQPLSLGDYAARLADSDQWLLDPRTTRIDLAELGAEGGRALVSMRETEPHRRAVVRLTYLQPLSDFERAVRARTLRIERGRRMVLGRSSLGFDDLPGAVRDRALSHWERRFPAIGRDGIDYVNRTVLIGHRLPSVPEDDTKPSEVRLKPGQRLALNFRAPVRVRVEAPPRAELEISEGSEPPFSVAVGERGSLELELPGNGARTVSFGAARETPVRLSVAVADGGNQIGRVERPLEDTRIALLPDTRVQRYLATHPERPVLFRLAPGQARLGLSVRALPEADVRSAIAELRLESAGGTAFVLEPFRAELETSSFDVAGERPVTRSRHVVVDVPEGTDSVAVFGSAGTLVGGWVSEPGVAVERIEPAYDVPLDEGFVWRHAPALERPIAAIRALNDAELEREDRVVRVRVQVRIEALRETGPELAERVAKPVGQPLTRIAWMPVQFTGTMALAGLWTLLSTKTVELEVPPVSKSADPFTVEYRVPRETLGKRLVLEVDGARELEETVMTTHGELRALVSRGRRRIAVHGLEGGTAFASAPPAAGGRAYRRRIVHELPAGRYLDFAIERNADELIAVFVELVRERGPGPVVLRYELDPGKRSPAQRMLARRLTVREGELSTHAAASERALLAEAELSPGGSELPSAVAKLRIVLGDDLAPGAHVLRLHAPSAAAYGRLYARAVVAGRRIESASSFGDAE